MKYEKKSLIASTQYNDWQGTIALDDAHKSIQSYFNNKINNENILGIEAYIMSDLEPIEVRLVIYTGNVKRDTTTGKRTDKRHPKVKAYKTNLTPEEFFKLFKRINIKTFEDIEARKDTKLSIVEEIEI